MFHCAPCSWRPPTNRRVALINLRDDVRVGCANGLTQHTQHQDIACRCDSERSRVLLDRFDSAATQFKPPLLRRDFTSQRTLNKPLWLCGNVGLLHVDNHLIHERFPLVIQGLR